MRLTPLSEGQSSIRPLDQHQKEARAKINHRNKVTDPKVIGTFSLLFIDYDLRHTNCNVGELLFK